jgi:hypothetical protein
MAQRQDACFGAAEANGDETTRPRRRRTWPVDALIGRERRFRKGTAPVKVSLPKMPEPMLCFPATEIG